MARVPGKRLALDKYRRGIAIYDDSNRFRRLRANSVARLQLKPGEVQTGQGVAITNLGYNPK